MGASAVLSANALLLQSGPASAEAAPGFETYYGFGLPPTSYGGYGGNADEDAKYTFEYPSGWKPSVPEDGFDLSPGSSEWERYERAGLAEAGKIGFVVPAGGLGERLGYHGVKFALPSEVSSGALVLEVYCAYIRAVERIARRAAEAVDHRAAHVLQEH